MMNYLTKILNATVYDVAERTPLDEAAELGRRHECTFLLKREDLQSVHSYKIRGAYNKMSRLSPAQLEKGVLAASAGNHAQGVALSAKRLGAKATIVMPVTTPEIKINAVKSLGAEIVLHGDGYSDCVEEADRLVAEKGYVFIPPYDDPDVIAGQGTVGKELLEQAPRNLTAVYVPVGGGGLAAGVSVYVKAVRPEVKVYGVEPEDSDCMFQSFKAGKRVTLQNPGLFADGVCVKKPGAETFRLCREHLDGIIRVTTAETCAAIKDIFEATRAVVEPAGALALAAAKKNAKKGDVSVCVISGANMNFDRIRFVSEETELGEGREAIFDCAIPEKPGSFLRFVNRIGKRSVTEFNYRMGPGVLAHIFVGISVKDPADRKALRMSFRAEGIHSIDLSENALAKEHVRHMVGGLAMSIPDEVVYTFEFPERPGALASFLSVISGRWNVSLFHYRNHGADHGKVLAGFQVPEAEREDFARALDEIGYQHTDVTNDPAYRYFLGRRRR
ncbi:MAG: threonine ammonia-lyase, biosynthetic [Kiritimatiellae bacterium]|nr:threonine ammonia-lyase, biosynthetic [Kiritimatiellia bacterium]